MTRLRDTVALATMMGSLLLAGCSGDGSDDSGDAPLPGKRISVLSSAHTIAADESLKDMQVRVPQGIRNASWPQHGGSPASVMPSLEVAGDFSHTTTERAGKGNGWTESLVISPIVAAGRVYAMDAHGYLSAHKAEDINKVDWVVSLTGQDHEVIGGGLAYDDGAVFAVTGAGTVVAVDAATGAEKWRRSVNLPMRASPRVAEGRVYVVTVTNQLLALDAADGRILWKHRGISEVAGMLGAAVPTVSDNVLVVPYSSGEIYGLDAESGREIWNDALILTNRTTPALSLSDIDGDPAIAEGRIYASGHSGLLASMDLGSGQRFWEQPISSVNTPWVAGEFLFVLSSDNEVIFLLSRDGSVKWVASLPGDKDSPVVWSGPELVGNQLVLTAEDGTLLALNPADGSVTGRHSIPSNTLDAPVVADGTLYFVTRGGDLVALR
ncbi:MAG: PQQ-binding-like beta-propeller repeat protein [Alphaproteobacteria bacterium]|nr:PQQ-binding-like beta-propeller repeat protein [Alphaproteobacteria bacterium]